MDLADALNALESSDDYRVLRRIPAVAEWRLGTSSEGDLRRAVFVDCETTGLSQDVDEVIELALVPFDYVRATGEIVRVDETKAFSAFREPTFPIPADSTRIHGITDRDVAGCVIHEQQLQSILSDAHLIIAHNAAFDRPMLEKHWAVFEQKHWACSLVDIDWKGEGLSTAKLDYLLMRLGWFYDGHRALGDALAGTFLLSLQLPASGRSALSVLLQSARRPLRAVRAEDTAFEQRAALKQRGYRWDAGGPNREKAWWILTDDAQAEVTWLNAEIYASPRQIPVLNVPPTQRYSARLWSPAE